MLVRRRKKIFLNSERVALPGDEISFVVDNTSFPKAIQIMVVNNTDFSDFNWGFATLDMLFIVNSVNKSKLSFCTPIDAAPQFI